jgi:putative tricarboxylic transport membrane protein
LKTAEGDKEMKKKDSIMAMFWILLGLTITIWSSRFPFGGLAHPGPAYFPVGLGLVITLFGVIVFSQAWKAREEGGVKPSAPPSSNRAARKRVVFCLAGMTLSAVLFETFGFVLTMFLMILFMMRTIAPQKWKTALFYSVVSALGSLFVFKVLLKTQLPGGFLGF